MVIGDYRLNALHTQRRRRVCDDIFENLLGQLDSYLTAGERRKGEKADQASFEFTDVRFDFGRDVQCHVVRNGDAVAICLLA